MSVEFYRGSPGKFDSRTLNTKTLNRWTGRMAGQTRGTACVHASGGTKRATSVNMLGIHYRGVQWEGGAVGGG